MRVWKKSTTSSPLALPRNLSTTATPLDKVRPPVHWTDDVCARLCVQYRHIDTCLSVSQMVIWIPCWTVPLWIATNHLPYPVVRNQQKRGVLKSDIVQRIQTHRVQKTHQTPKRKVPKTRVQVRNRHQSAPPVCKQPLTYRLNDMMKVHPVILMSWRSFFKLFFRFYRVVFFSACVCIYYWCNLFLGSIWFSVFHHHTSLLIVMLYHLLTRWLTIYNI